MAFCEIDPYCRKVLAKHWPGVPIHDDVTKLDGSQYVGAVDVVCGGYPCQPFSVAGKQAGEKDPRHLWPEMFRIIRECRPRWVICENVSGHIKLGFDTVASQLEDEGFTVWPFLIPACAVGAPHRRERLWIVGYAEHHGLPASTLAGGIVEAGHDHAERQEQTGQFAGAGRPISGGDVVDACCPRGTLGIPATGQRQEGDAGIAIDRGDQLGGRAGGHQWSVEPGMGRVANGVPDRSHRLKALGNAVVPQIPELIGRTIMQYERCLAA